MVFLLGRLLCMLIIGGRCFRRLAGGQFSVVLIGSLGCLLSFEYGLVRLIVVVSPLVCRIENRTLRLDVLFECLTM